MALLFAIYWWKLILFGLFLSKIIDFHNKIIKKTFENLSF